MEFMAKLDKKKFVINIFCFQAQLTFYVQIFGTAPTWCVNRHIRQMDFRMPSFFFLLK